MENNEKNTKITYTLITENTDAVFKHRSLWANSLLCTGTGWRQINDAQCSPVGWILLITRFFRGSNPTLPSFFTRNFTSKFRFTIGKVFHWMLNVNKRKTMVTREERMAKQWENLRGAYSHSWLIRIQWKI